MVETFKTAIEMLMSGEITQGVLMVLGGGAVAAIGILILLINVIGFQAQRNKLIDKLRQ